MTNKQRFISALKREKLSGRVPTFELVFFLTMEAFGKVHPLHRDYTQWNQMSSVERKLHIEDMADVYIMTAKKYEHSAIFIHQNPATFEVAKSILTSIREKTNDEFFLMMHGDPTMAIPNGDDMMEFSAQLYEDPESIIAKQKKNTEYMLGFASEINKHDKLLDGFALCSDYCFNLNPFFSPSIFADIIAPQLATVISEYRKLGFYTIKHSDGNIMPILDQIVQCKPDAIHSLDPQGGVDLAKVKKLYGDKVCLIGNVNCGLLQTGSEEQATADVMRALKDGMDGTGYIFSTSNCAYTGLSLERYELMNNLWKKYGNY